MEQESRSLQVILKVPEAFLKRFDKTVTELGYTRTEAIREAMRRFQAEGEKRQAEKPEVVAEIVAKVNAQANIEQWNRIFEMLRQRDEARRPIVLQPSKPENAQK